MRPGPRARAVAAGLSIALVAAALELGLVRSFEFLPFPKAVEPWRPGPETRAALAAARERSRAPERTDWFQPARGLTLVIVDGMRLDVAEKMPNLRALGADWGFVAAHADFPTFSKVSYATILTGAPPRVHGFLSNYRRGPVPVESLVDVAREAGLHTRFLTDSLSWIPRMFPAFAETTVLDPARFGEAIAAGPERHLTVVYFGEPDIAAHAHGPRSPGALEAARRVDAQIGRLAASLDLSKDALVIVSDHGHIDRGGHGGHEWQCLVVPALFCGPGPRGGDQHGKADLVASTRHQLGLREVAPEVARKLGLRPPAGALVEAPRGPATLGFDGAGAVRALLGAVVLAALVSVRRARPRTFVAAALGIAAFFGLFALRGYPFSWSCINEDAHIPVFAAEVLGFAIAGHLLGALVARDRGPDGHAPTALAVAVALAASLGAVCGPTAATALDFPQVAFVYHLALSLLFAKGLCAAVAASRCVAPAPEAA